MLFQLLLCGECYENIYTLKAYKISIIGRAFCYIMTVQNTVHVL
jgi:hypothetical protein